MKWGIASRTAAVFSLLILVATATVGYMVYQGARQSLISASTDRLAHTAEIIQVRLSASLEAVGKDVRFLAATPPVQGIIRARTHRRRGYQSDPLDPETAISDGEWRAQLAAIFEVFLANRPTYLRASFIGVEGSGRELVRVEKREGETYRAGRRALQQIAGHEYFKEALRADEGMLYLSEIRLNPEPGVTQGIPLLRAATPVVGPGGRVFGIILIDVDFRDVLGTLQALATPDKALYISNSEGDYLLHPDSTRTFGFDRGRRSLLQNEFPAATALYAHTPRYTRLIQEDLGGGISAYFGRILFDRGVERDAMVLGITSPHETILAGVKTVRDRSLFITLLFCLSGILLSLALSGFLTRPLSQITRALSHFGHEGWNAELPRRRKDEIGVLARTFDTMAVQIRDQMRELEDKEERQRMMFETSAEGILVMNADGTIDTFNKAAERLFGYRAEEVIGQNVSLLLPPSAQEAPTASWRRPGSGHEVTGRRFDGSTMTLSLAVSAFEHSGEQRYAAFVQDITERKLYETALQQAKEQAEEMARLKSAFLANMSHEIRTPLTSVIGYASVLAKEASDKHRRFAQLIKSSGRRLMDTLNSVLALAQLEASRVDVQLQPVKVAEEVEEIVQLFHTQAVQKGLTLAFHVEPGAHQAQALLNHGALTSIVQNLIGNALKFTYTGGLDVRVETDGRRVVIHVEDSGVGIDPAFLPHLFNEFTQESTGLSRSHEGSGLGLSITKRLVEIMHGDISVRSEKGRGSVFTVTFPLYLDGGLPAPSAALPASAGAQDDLFARIERPNVLVVEDNPDTADLICHILQTVCTVTVASNAEEALAAAGDRPYDLVFLDINLGPGPNGIDVLGQLRAMPAYHDVPIAALTAYALPGDHEHFLAQGFSTYLSKPFTEEELLQLTSRLVLQG